MDIVFSPLSRLQLRKIVAYTKIEFGTSVALKVRARLYKDIQRLSVFYGISPVWLSHRGCEIRRMVSSLDYVYYTMHNDNVYIIAIFDTRMSPDMMRATVIGNLPE